MKRSSLLGYIWWWSKINLMTFSFVRIATVINYPMLIHGKNGNGKNDHGKNGNGKLGNR